MTNIDQLASPVNLSAEQDKQLILNGYEPVPISNPTLDKPGAGQAPFIEGWRDGEITVERMATWRAEHPDHPGTGLRTGRLTAVDVDVVEEAHWHQVAALAFHVLGETPLLRQGSKGIMLSYRTACPLSKLTISHLLDGKRRTLVEVLGTGQQFVAFGIHPKTGKPYRWTETEDDPDPALSVTLSPLTVPLASLPEATPAKLRDFATKAAALLAELGYKDVKVSGDTGEERKVSASTGEPVAEKALRQALSYLDPNEAREEWRNVVAGIRAANIEGDDDLEVRKTLALEWSRGELDRLGRYKAATPSLYTGDDDVLAVFNTMEPRADGIGVGTVFDKAQAAGWKGSPFDDGAPASEKFADFKMPPQVESPDTVPGGDFGGVTFERMSDVKLQRISWLWDRRIPAGMLSVIGGDPDCGKSSLVYCLVAAVTKGGPLPLNGGKADKGAVIVLNAEDVSGRVLGPRLKAAGCDLALVYRVKPMVAIEGGRRVFDLGVDLDNIKAKITQLRKAGEVVKLITIDPLNAYYGANIDGNNSADLRRLLTPLAEWADENQVTILVVAHLNKNNATGNALNRISGSHAVGAAARSVILVAPERGDGGEETGRFLFMRGKNNMAPRNIANLAYRLETTNVGMDDGSTEQHPYVVWDSEVAVTATEAFDPNYGKGNKQDKAEAFLLAVLADGAVAVEELKRMAAERGLGWRTVETAKAKLSIRSDHKGFTRNGGWFWRLRNKEAEDAANDVNRQPVDPDDELLYAGAR